MDFIEEKTPKGFTLKILLNSWQFLAFDRKGKSIYVDKEGRSMVHKVSLICFVGKNLTMKKDYNQDYILLKIRNGSIVVPYVDQRDKRTKFFFIQTDKNLDLIPVRMIRMGNVAQMVKEIDMKQSPDFVAVGEDVTANDIIIIKSRYKLDFVYNLEIVNNFSLNKEYMPPEDEEHIVNLNMMSANPVFLARIHIRSMELAKINQLLLDFEVSALDTEYIINFLETLRESASENPAVEKHLPMINELTDNFRFYLYLLQRNTAEADGMIRSRESLKKLDPFRTLVSKVKSMYPGKEDQLLFTEYENMIMDRRSELQAEHR